MYSRIFENSDKGYEKVFLSFSTFKNRASNRIFQHTQCMDLVLEWYIKSWYNVIVIIGENCVINKSLKNSLLLPLVGCENLMFNLVVKEKMEKHSDIFDKVHTWI